MQAGDILTQTEVDRINALEDALYLAFPYVQDHEGSAIYKAGAAALAQIRAALGE
jgi:hypothetical protein